jgi:hypothetical protein
MCGFGSICNLPAAAFPKWRSFCHLQTGTQHKLAYTSALFYMECLCKLRLLFAMGLAFFSGKGSIRAVHCKFLSVKSEATSFSVFQNAGLTKK